MPQAEGSVLLVESPAEWPPELIEAIRAAGYNVVHIDDARLAPFFVLAGGVAAIVVDTSALEMLGVLSLRECRAASPSTAVVAIALDATAPTVKRALESGATAFLSWPAQPHLLERALRSGAR